MSAVVTTRRLSSVPPASTLDEYELAEACVAGDREAQRRLLEIVFDPVVRVVTQNLGRRTASEDAVQDALIEILRSLRYYRGECSLTTWARKIAVRLVIRQIRKRRRREALSIFIPREMPVEPIAVDAISERERALYVNSLLARLPVKQQVVMRLRYFEDLRIAEIAAVVGVPEETVRDRLKTAKRKLRRMLRDHPIVSDLVRRGES